MTLLILAAAAHAAPTRACPSTQPHIVAACGGCRPLFEDISNAGHDVSPETQQEVERCVRSVLGKEGRPWVEGARACVRESRVIEDELGDWLLTWLDASGRGDAAHRGADDRRWSQCSVQIRHMDTRPGLCVSQSGVSLDMVKRRGRSKLALELGVSNRCVRPVNCAMTVSARREGPASDGATGVEEVALEPSSTTSVAVKLRFPSATASKLASWSVSDLRCAYPGESASPVVASSRRTPAAEDALD